MGFTAVVGYDGRPEARAALDVALGLVQRLDGKLVVAYLFDAPPDLGLCRELKADGEQLVKGALMAAGSRGVEAESIVANAPVAEGLVGIARERCADLLVVGSSRESAFVGAIFGSACHKLVHCTTVPLVVVPPRPGNAEE